MRFARDIDAETNRYLQEAAASPEADRAEAVLTKAARLSPDLLAVDVARYKFYFYRGRLQEAEGIVRWTLVKAANQGGFDADWRRLTGPMAGRERTEGPARYYLYGLKALAFIDLRTGAVAESREVLERLRELDPDDLVGSSVIAEMLEALEESP